MDNNTLDQIINDIDFNNLKETLLKVEMLYSINKEYIEKNEHIFFNGIEKGNVYIYLISNLPNKINYYKKLIENLKTTVSFYLILMKEENLDTSDLEFSLKILHNFDEKELSQFFNTFIALEYMYRKN
jgi:hypothetical protein